MFLFRHNDRRIKRIGAVCLIKWTIAITAWICDRIFCSFWLSISFPYLHSIWHVLIFFSSNEVIVVCAYLLITQETPQANIQIYIWPNKRWGLFGLPYVKFHDDKTDVLFQLLDNTSDDSSIEEVSSDDVFIQLDPDLNETSTPSNHFII